MPELIVPTVTLHQAWLEAHREWPSEHQDGSGLADGDEVESADGFATFVTRLLSEADEAKVLPADRVHCSYWWITEGRVVLGAIALRHELNDALRDDGGHIGYSVRPSARRRGLAQWALDQVVQQASAMGITQVLLTCAVDNEASQRTIESAGGVRVDVNDANSDRVRRFWITSAAAAAVRDLGRSAEQPAWSGTARVVRGSAVVEESSVGLMNGPGSQPCNPLAQFQACSISKLVVSTVVLALVESGVLDLNRPVGAWLTDLPSSWSTITLHQLLSNTSGLGHWGDIPGLPRLLTTPPPREELLALIAAAPLVASPGKSWRYSGPGFLTAARVVEAATGQPYALSANALIFTPAAMAATISGRPAPGDPSVAVGHDHGRPWPLHPNFADVTGSGDLWTTTDDLVRLSQVLRTEQLLKVRSSARLWTRHAALATDESDGSGPIVMTGYGYGTFLGRIRGHQARINPGDAPGYQTLLAHLPDRELDVAVLCNEEAPSLDAALADLRLP